MVLYSEEAWDERGITETQLQTNIAAAFPTSDAAMENSEVDLKFTLVHVGKVSAQRWSRKDPLAHGTPPRVVASCFFRGVKSMPRFFA